MCKCNPQLRTPWCGRPLCVAPKTVNKEIRTYLIKGSIRVEYFIKQEIIASNMADAHSHFLKQMESDNGVIIEDCTRIERIK